MANLNLTYTPRVPMIGPQLGTPILPIARYVFNGGNYGPGKGGSTAQSNIQFIWTALVSS